MKRTIVFLVSMMLLVGQAVIAQTDAGTIPPMAAVVNGQVVRYLLDGTMQSVDLGIGSVSIDSVGELIWSPDGQWLAVYIVYNNFSEGALIITDFQNPVQVTEHIDLPPTFTPDGSQLLYAVLDDPTQPTSDFMFSAHIYAYDLSSGETSTLGQITLIQGCGGGSSLPMDTLYWRESAFSGQTPIFEVTDSGLVYSADCFSTSIGLFDLQTGESRLLSDDFGRATLSPDKTQLVGLLGTQRLNNGDEMLATLELSTGEVTSIATLHIPDQLTWGDANTLYYSYRIEDGILPLTDDQRAFVANNLSAGLGSTDIRHYSIGIQHIDLNTGEETTVWTGEGWAVGRLFVVDGVLYFSVVDNGMTWIESLMSDMVDLSQPYAWERQLASVSVALYALPFDGDAAVIVADNLSQATPAP